MAHPLRAAFTRPTHPVIRADPAAPVDPAARAAPVGLRADLAGQVAPAIRAAPMVPVAPADRGDPVDLIILAAPAGQAGPTTQAAPAAQAGPTTQAAPAGLAVPAAPGTEIPSAATSVARHGVTGRRPGDQVCRRDPIGTDRSPRPVGTGDTARSTTGVMRRLPCGTPASISGASGSSESGFRCKQQ
ncbi:hypothetical protein A5681_19870 [Mycobacterium scrofulaceum]|nr:hypothetical protein A5681_19870 [Mycobacterium scrofulaceum]